MEFVAHPNKLFCPFYRSLYICSYKFSIMKSQYLPVDPDFPEQIEKTISENKSVIVHYFKKGNEVETTKGLAKKIATRKNGEFIVFENGEEIRLDRIIVFNGKPGPAYDEYDSYALACLDCMGGMD